MQYLFQLRRTFTILMVLSSCYSFGQIQGTIFGLSEINGQPHFVRVNPNTGFVNSLGAQTTPQGWEMPESSAAAMNCNSGQYAYRANTLNGNQVFVLDAQNGNLVTTFGYDLTGLVYNELTNLFYGLERVSVNSANFISFDPILGIRNVISLAPLTITAPNDLLYSGFTLNVNAGHYIYLDVIGGIHSIITIDISTGQIISTAPITLGNLPYTERFYGISFANDNNICYGLTTNMTFGYQIFCSVNPATGVITKLDSTFDVTLMGPENDGLSSGSTISESDHVMTYISYYNKVVSYNYLTGAVSSSPLLSINNPVYFIQYSNCSLVGLDEDNRTENSLIITPNPSNGILNLQVSPNLLQSDYSIIDAQGRQLVSGVFVSTTTILDLSDFDNGVYFLKNSFDNYTSKIIIQK